MKTFVFLHDAFHGGWVWENVAQALRHMDCAAYTPSLTGCGERSHLQPQDNPITTYRDDILNLFRYEDIDNAVLVCNGVAGLLAPILVEQLGDTIADVVFLDALLPQPGNSYRDSVPLSVQEQWQNHSGTGMVQPSASVLLMLLSTEPEMRKLSPFPLRAFLEPCPAGWPQHWPACHFLHCSGNDDALATDMRDRAQALDMDVHELPLSERPYHLRHEELASTLKAITSAPADNAEFGPCGRRRIPEDLRMTYCAHHRKRIAMASSPDHRATHGTS